jgi:NAD(P)H-dependent flavin oxidoreductase YrpB (nitropropane dioxygenase family)
MNSDAQHPSLTPIATVLTPICDLLAIDYPIVQAGMSATYTNPALVAAVSASGGLGVLGCLGRPADQAVADLRRIRELTDRPFGVNFVVHRLDPDTFAACLDLRPPVVAFFRGEPTDVTRVVARAKASGARVLYQVTTVAEAEQALAAGADALIAQGCEAGGHMGPHPLTVLLPAVVAVAGERPVLAAGGIVDGAGLDAALCLGAAGAWIGTRFLATPEAPVSATYRQALLAAKPGETVAAATFDLVWDTDWPGVHVRTLRNSLTDRWSGREAEIPAHRVEIQDRVHQAEAADDPDEYFLLVGAGAGRIDAICPAGDLVRQLTTDAAQILRQLSARVSAAQ